MKLNFNSVLIFSENPKNLAQFYQEVFQKDPDWVEQEHYSFLVGKAAITIGLYEKASGENKNPERMMLIFETEDVKAEFERIKDLGAEVIAEPYSSDTEAEMWLATLADPNGNYFQLVSPWKNDKF